MSKIWDGQEKHTHANIMENRKYSLVCNNDPNLMGVQGKYFFLNEISNRSYYNPN